MFIGFFSKNLSFSKQKSIAVLKALGAKTKEILFYHWLDLFTVSILVLFLGFVFIIPIIPEIYKIISKQDFAQPSYKQVTIIFLITWIIMFAILALIYFLTSRKIYKKSVISLLNN
ncbi:FtsX-like permease family protein [Mycoplasma sp. 'Moose RK']|uniref:FtsX-like permease family protein n=1 Tax=Mycoplasma sp. 'Moose RK' TaxID=2780095 RepID=UPI0018C28F50|nr:FtsX-like permease family protein [Mycoplasma sp. 'Moose RK']MBG0730536.1 FtsX-like permease family protein [Mycoplasma sp. 'Moose RK']